MDFPAAGQALWAISDATGARPEYLIPVLAYESGLQTNIQNHMGAPYYGIGQNGVSDILAGGASSPQDYMTWSASQQLNNVVGPYFQRYAPFGSGIKVYQAEYMPASLKYAPGIDDVIASSPDLAYNDNASFDTEGKGYITPRDLGAAVAKEYALSYVKSAIAQTYALRPNEVQQDPILGTDFSGFSASVWPKRILISAAVATVVVGGLVVAEKRGLIRNNHPLLKARTKVRRALGLA